MWYKLIGGGGGGILKEFIFKNEIEELCFVNGIWMCYYLMKYYVKKYSLVN